MPDELLIRPGLTLPRQVVVVRAMRSSGPGGQHANVTASRVEVSVDLVACEGLLPEHLRARMLHRLGRHVRASAQDTRSQARNRQLALDRLAARLAGALELQAPRVATRPSRNAKRRRVAGKRVRGQLKRNRRRPSGED